MPVSWVNQAAWLASRAATCAVVSDSVRLADVPRVKPGRPSSAVICAAVTVAALLSCSAPEAAWSFGPRAASASSWTLLRVAGAAMVKEATLATSPAFDTDAAMAAALSCTSKPEAVLARAWAMVTVWVCVMCGGSLRADAAPWKRRACGAG